MTTVQEGSFETNTHLKGAILRQPEIVAELLANLQGQVRNGLDPEIARALRKGYITGCGDSYFAGVAAELAFHEFAGIDTHPVEALNFSRYLASYAPTDSVLIAISNSGMVSRTIEAARRAREHMSVWAFTDSPKSPLATTANWMLSPGIPSMPTGGTGTISYLASLLALYTTAILLGRLRDVLRDSEVEELMNALKMSAGQIEATLDLNQDATRAYAEALPVNTLYFVGGGPNLGTAMYGAAKVMEALSLNGVAVELEEWAHLEFHTTGPDTYYVLVAPPGGAYDRALEQAQGIIDSGGRLAVVVDKDDTDLAERAEVVFRVDGPKQEAFTPLVYCVPLQLLAVELAIARNQSMKMRLDERRKEINFRQIFHSRIVA